MDKAKRIAYISMYNSDKNDGVVKKILNQIKTFNNSGFEVDYFFARRRCFYVHSEKDVLLGKSKRIKSIDFCKYMIKYMKPEQYDCVYVRHTGRIDPWLLRVLKLLHNSGAIILYEFPTFPYEQLRFTKMGKIDQAIDYIFRRYLRLYVDRTITMTGHDEILNIPNIYILNGICVDDIKPISSTEDNGTIDLLAVACFYSYHGYDRIISSLSRYYHQGGNKEIKLHMVGEGPASEELKQHAKEYDVEDKVIFYGFKTGEELDEIYEKADIALGSLALYRINIDISSNLKIREYLAKGLPIISGCKEDAFDYKSEYKYYLQVLNDSSDIEMKTIIDFYARVYDDKLSRARIREEIRSYAKEKVDMMNTMKPIVEYYNSV